MNSPFGAYALTPLQNSLLKQAQAMPVNWCGRRGALILRKIVLSGGLARADVMVEGLKFRLYLTDNVSERKFLFMPQFFDRYERDLLRARLRPGDFFVDVGANAGIYSLTAAAAVGSGGHVLAIEPNPVVLNRLLFNALQNGFESVIAAEQSGVSDVVGQFDLVLDESNLGGSSLVTARSDKSISVPCHTLLDIVQRHRFPRIDAMKMDIEGAEDRALIPFLERAPREILPRVLILENSVKDWKRDLQGALRQSGYKLLRTTRMNLVWEL